ncbi:hypothetical protein ES703_10470 [subsurface metagenome]
MLLKAGVDISRLKRNIRRSLTIVDSIMEDESEILIITSTFEGNHSAGSLHYADQAYDMRIPIYDPSRIFGRIKEALGSKFDVVWEEDHIHVEYDPK